MMQPSHAREVSVLVVEDEHRFREFMIDTLADMNCRPTGAANAREATRIAASSPPDILVLDLNLPVTDGLTFLEQFRESQPHTPVVIVTGFGDLRAAKRSIQLGVTEFLTKPCHLGEIEQAMNRARRQIVRDEPAPDSPHEPEFVEQSDVSRPLSCIERDAILESLRATGGNRTATSAALGISRRALYNKINQYRSEGHVIP